jgi:DNA-binding XRE family transcriptional regulator
MARTIEQFIAFLLGDQQEETEACYDELRQEVEELRELRQIAGKDQEDVATVLNIYQPSVFKIENRAGKLELTVRLRTRLPLLIEHLGKLAQSAAKLSGRRVGSRRRVA